MLDKVVCPECGNVIDLGDFAKGESREWHTRMYYPTLEIHCICTAWFLINRVENEWETSKIILKVPADQLYQEDLQVAEEIEREDRENKAKLLMELA